MWKQRWFKCITIYLAAWSLYKVLCQTCFACEFLHCCVHNVSAGVCIGGAPKMYFCIWTRNTLNKLCVGGGSQGVIPGTVPAFY
jgi:hypothetical protein